MKRFITLFMIALLLMLSSVFVFAEPETDSEESASPVVEDKAYYEKFRGKGLSINVYNWGEYIPDGSEDGVMDLNAEFTALTGIEVNYTTFATNEELYAKLKGGGANYDIIIPSDYMISRMIKEDMLEPLNFENIPNHKNIMKKFLHPEYDPDNRFSVPYTWGTVGIIYNKNMVNPETMSEDWDILWDDAYKDSILMFDNPRDAFMIAQLLLGYSINTEDAEELQESALKLLEQKKVVQAYVMDEIFDKMGAGEAALAPYYAGDALTMMEEHDFLDFFLPKSGTNLFFDAVCIPKGCREKEAAECYINFLCEPDVAYAVTDFIGYSTPNQAAFDMLDDEVKEDPISYPDDEYLTGHTAVYRNLSDEANDTMQRLWTDFKSSDTDGSNPWIMPIFLIGCILLSIGIVVWRSIRKKRERF